MKYCCECSAPVEVLVPEGDQLPRHVCVECKTIHYQNPKIVTGCLVEHDNRLLLCKRGIEPRLGLWTLPAGFLENQESVDEGAIRETREETLADVEIINLFAMYSIPHINQVYMIYRARLLAENFGPTPESTEVELFSRENIPWDSIAFPVIEQTLKAFFDARDKNDFSTITSLIDKRTTL